MIDLASNANCLGPSALAVKAIHETAGSVNRYPDPSGETLRNTLAERLGVAAEQVVLGNGSTELVEIIARCFLLPQRIMITAKQTFMMYRQAAESCRAQCREIPNQNYAYDLPAISNAVSEHTGVIFIANPNNPTGLMLTQSDLHEFLSKISSSIIVVLDEAYREYIEREDYPDGIDYLRQFENVIVLRTFSKIHGLAGLRIGYAIASKSIAARLNQVRAPYNSNLVAQAAALAALADPDHSERSRRFNFIERDFLHHQLEALNVRVIPSVANFLLLLVDDSRQLYEKLLGFGILTRPMHASNISEGLRVTVGTREENVALIDALKNITR